MVNVILVRKRAGDWWAGDPTETRWGCGRTVAEAVGQAVLAHQAHWRVTVVDLSEADPSRTEGKRG